MMASSVSCSGGFELRRSSSVLMFITSSSKRCLARMLPDTPSVCAGQRGTVMFAAAAGLVVLTVVPLSMFARMSLAAMTVGNILFWKACMPSSRADRRHV